MREDPAHGILPLAGRERSLDTLKKPPNEEIPQARLLPVALSGRSPILGALAKLLHRVPERVDSDARRRLRFQNRRPPFVAFVGAKRERSGNRFCSSLGAVAVGLVHDE